jgi:hypothetical protein
MKLWMNKKFIASVLLIVLWMKYSVLWKGGVSNENKTMDWRK